MRHESNKAQAGIYVCCFELQQPDVEEKPRNNKSHARAADNR